MLAEGDTVAGQHVARLLGDGIRPATGERLGTRFPLLASYNAFVSDHTARLLGVTRVPGDRGEDRNVGWEITGVPAALIAEFSRRTTGSCDGAEGIEQAENRLIEQHLAEHAPSPRASGAEQPRQRAHPAMPKSRAAFPDVNA